MAGTGEEDFVNFLKSLDPGLLKYKNQFEKYDVQSLTTLKYLRPREVDAMDIPEVFKRLLLDRIVNLQTPETKTKMKGERLKQVEFERKPMAKRLRFNDDLQASTDASRPSTESDKEVTDQPKKRYVFAKRIM